MANIRWGILAPGNIARQFATGLKAADNAELVAAGSRDAGRARAFAEEFGAERSYGSYAELAADAEVDAVYVASPHSGHKEHSILCLEAGKAVLCEKPFAINAQEARAMVDCARANGAPLLEAMWTRFLPVMDQVRRWIAEGRIGEARMVQADFAFRAGFNPEGRLFNPALGGGGLLDVGIYVISFAAMAFGRAPKRVTGFAEIGETGVDEQATMALDFGDGKLASLITGVRTSTAHAACIYGTEGVIRMEPPFWKATRATLSPAGQDEETFDQPHKGNGYEYQAEELGRLIGEGKTESDIMPLDESIALVEAMDELRKQWGVRYPMEE